MTPKQYEQRIAALGFENGTSWAAFVGINRATHYRHLQRKKGPPKYLQHIVTMLELLPDMNPNRPASPFTDINGRVIREGDTLRHPSGKTGVVVRLTAMQEPACSLWRVSYGSWPLSYLSTQVGSRVRAVVVKDDEV